MGRRSRNFDKEERRQKSVSRLTLKLASVDKVGSLSLQALYKQEVTCTYTSLEVGGSYQ